MADPLEDLLDPPAPPAGTDPAPPADPAPAPPTGTTIDPAELERLRRAAERSELLESQVQLLQAAQQQYRAPEPAPEGDPNADFFVDPRASVRKEIDATVTPYARQMAAQIGAMSVNNFKAGKTGDRFYAGVAPFFDKKAQGIDKSWLGSLTPEQQQSVLNEAWSSAKGAYLDDYEKKNPPKPAPPPNIGGGSAGGGGSVAGGKASLEQLDPWTYKQAVQAGWSQERMDKFAAELLKEQE